jgi:cystathionine beta-lyase/cystathionine gamma-synthase
MSDLGPSSPLVPPLYQSSVYCLPDLDALDRVMDGEEDGFIYARDGHPNGERLAERLADLEGAGWALVCGSGMAAVSAAILATVQQGDALVASNRLYGRTTQLFLQELSRFGITATFTDSTDLEQVEQALRGGAKLLFVETLSNPLLRLADLPALARLAHDRGCLLIVDNTFATPCLCRPLELGADVVIESLTKMIGGHSDITLGILCGGRADQEDEQATVTREQTAPVVSIWGLSSPPFDCWLAERSLDTLALRVRAACDNAQTLADWLSEQRSVRQVIYPGRADHPDHDIAERLFAGAAGDRPLYGNMLCFELAGGRDGVNRFMRMATDIPFSPSLGNTTTTCSHPGTTSHRYVSPAEKKRQGIGDGLIRLSVGIENLAQIQTAISKGL